MRKKKISFTIHVNEWAAKKLKLSPQEIGGLDTICCDLNRRKIKEIDFPAELALLRGARGEAAYIKSEGGKKILAVEFPPSSTIDEQRKWTGYASKFFRTKLISDSETVPIKEDFKRIKGKPYSDFKSYEYDPRASRRGAYFKTRIRKCSDGAPYGSKTTRKQDLESRNKWIRERYQLLKKDKSLSKYFVRYDRISEESVGKSFGNLRITKPLETYTIKNIIYSARQKISD